MTRLIKNLLLSVVALSASTQAEIYFVHSDHLGVTQKLTDKNQKVVWEVESQTPFGELKINEDPDGDGDKVVYSLRFPGQYFDEETGLNYNLYRYYDSFTGRYTQSDPVGLAGGLNTYAYVLGNPLKYTDRLGLLPDGWAQRNKYGDGWRRTDASMRAAGQSGADGFSDAAMVAGLAGAVAGKRGLVHAAAVGAGINTVFGSLGWAIGKANKWAFPNDGDNDNDGIPNTSDPDDDNDGIPDQNDANPDIWDPSASSSPDCNN